MKVKIMRWEKGAPMVTELRHVIGQKLNSSNDETTNEGALEYIDNRLGKVTNTLAMVLEFLVVKKVLSIQEVLALSGAQYLYQSVTEACSE